MRRIAGVAKWLEISAVVAVVISVHGQLDCNTRLDEDGFFYQPILCADVVQCACPTVGTSVCGPCVADTGSPFQDQEVCYCTNVVVLDESPRIECHPSKYGGPAFSTSGAVANNQTDDICYQPIVCSDVSECDCPTGGSPQCGPCPSSNLEPPANDADVCFCSGVDIDGAEATQCSPSRPGGPALLLERAATTEIATPTPAATPASSNGSGSMTVILAAAIPAAVVVAVCFTLFCCLMKRRRKRRANDEKASAEKQSNLASLTGNPGLKPNQAQSKSVVPPPSLHAASSGAVVPPPQSAGDPSGLTESTPWDPSNRGQWSEESNTPLESGPSPPRLIDTFRFEQLDASLGIAVNETLAPRPSNAEPNNNGE